MYTESWLQDVLRNNPAVRIRGATALKNNSYKENAAGCSRGSAEETAEIQC